jgi:carbamoyl-phosphate synthase/aspartate carbamoyltransferase/dihydroorotase
VTVLRLPGLIDPHVHVREPGGTHKEDWDTGTAAALAGGFTVILVMPNTIPPITDAASLDLAATSAADKARCDYGIHLGAGADNVDAAASLANRVTGLKMYLDQTFGPLRLEDLESLAAHMAAWPRHRPVLCHAEERTMAAAILVAHAHDRPVHVCHVARRSEVRLIRRAKDRGIAVTCEVTPHHLYLTADDAAALPPGRGEVRPTLGTAADRAALRDAAADGTIDCIATDHAPHTIAEKDSSDPPPGFPGLETALGLAVEAVHDGWLEAGHLVDLMHTNPARIFGLPPQSDTWIEIDVDALRPAETRFSRCGWTPFAGRQLRGLVQRVVLRGEDVFRDGAVIAPPGHGYDVMKGNR